MATFKIKHEVTRKKPHKPDEEESFVSMMVTDETGTYPFACWLLPEDHETLKAHKSDAKLNGTELKVKKKEIYDTYLDRAHTVRLAELHEREVELNLSKMGIKKNG